MTGYWNVSRTATSASAARAGYLGVERRRCRAANTAICSAARAVGATCVDLYARSWARSRNPTPLLSSDGDHPNAAGHDVIAAALLRATRF